MIRIITKEEFNNYSKLSPLSSYKQTINYGNYLEHQNKQVLYIGYFENNILQACSLFIIKKISYKYSYAESPNGFLINYFDENLLNRFISELKSYFKEKNYIYIKFNPEIQISYTNKINRFKSIVNDKLINTLNSFNFNKNNNYLNNTCIINLKDYNENLISKSTRNKINQAKNSGLSLEKVNVDKLIEVSLLCKGINLNSIINLYNSFVEDKLIDVFLVKLNFLDYLNKSRIKYENEFEKNSFLNRLLQLNNNATNLNQKMESDKILLKYKSNMDEALKEVNNDSIYVGAAIIIKHKNRITFKYAGYDENYKHLNINNYMYNEILKYYRDSFDYADLNGITSSMNTGLDKFKIGFATDIIGFIGEYDIILNDFQYSIYEKKTN